MMEQDHIACAACGVNVPAARRFCTNCGVQHQAAATPQAAPPTPSEPTAPQCAHCGADLISGKKFCTGCGRQVPADGPEIPARLPNPVPYAPTQATPALYANPATPGAGAAAVVPSYAQHQPPYTPAGSATGTSLRPRRGRRLLIAALALVVLGGSGAAAIVTLGSDGETSATDGADRTTTRSDDDEPAEDSTSVDDTTDAPVPVDTVTVTAEPTTEPTAPDSQPPAPTARVLCWDNTTATATGQCTAPSGTAGLRHVFPNFDFDGEFCDTAGVRLPSTRRYHYQCAEEGDVWFNFSEFDSQDAGEGYYIDNAGAAGTPIRGDLLQWTFFNGRQYKGALMYADGRWGVTVYSFDAAARDQAIANLSRRMIPATRLRGRLTR